MRERAPDVEIMRVLENYGDGTFRMSLDGFATFDRVPAQDPKVRKILRKDDLASVGFEDGEWTRAFIIAAWGGAGEKTKLGGWPAFRREGRRTGDTGRDDDGPSLASPAVPILTAIDQNAHRCTSERVLTWRRKVVGGAAFEAVSVRLDAGEGDGPEWASNLPAGIPLTMFLDEDAGKAYVVQYPDLVILI